jgi:hypothetical protein
MVLILWAGIEFQAVINLHDLCGIYLECYILSLSAFICHINGGNESS